MTWHNKRGLRASRVCSAVTLAWRHLHRGELICRHDPIYITTLVGSGVNSERRATITSLHLFNWTRSRAIDERLENSGGREIVCCHCDGVCLRTVWRLLRFLWTTLSCYLWSEFLESDLKKTTLSFIDLSCKNLELLIELTHICGIFQIPTQEIF